MFARYTRVIHTYYSSIENFKLLPRLFLYGAGNDSHNRNGKRYIYMYCNTSIVYNKMNLISVVIYRHDWIRYLCGVIEIFMEYHREMKDSFILENVYKYRDTRICFG